MHVKLTTSGGRRYVQLVESYRDEAGRVKKRTVATLGRAEQLDGSLDAVINGLLKITGREPMAAKPPAPTVSFESARALGNVWALTAGVRHFTPIFDPFGKVPSAPARVSRP